MDFIGFLYTLERSLLSHPAFTRPKFNEIRKGGTRIADTKRRVFPFKIKICMIVNLNIVYSRRWGDHVLLITSDPREYSVRIKNNMHTILHISPVFQLFCILFEKYEETRYHSEIRNLAKRFTVSEYYLLLSSHTFSHLRNNSHRPRR